MSSSKPTRQSRKSRKHLSTDYEWDRIDGLLPTSFDRGDDLATSHALTTSTKTDNVLPFVGTSPATGPLDTAPRVLLPSPGAIPKLVKSKSSKISKTPEAANLDTVSHQNHALELEIRKLELQLELAKLAPATPLSVPTAAIDDSSESLGDAKAPQKTRFPQPWPHIFAPGEPQLYSDLSLAEFCAGYIAILQQYPDGSNRFPPGALLSHFHELMVLSCSYQWSAVRAYHYKVLRSIEMGLVKWGDSFEPFKQPFFIPTALLPPPDKTSKSKKPQPKLTSPSPSILRHDICDAWSWHDDCTNSACPKQHVCVVCKRSDHQAFCCPKRRYPVPTRRPDASSRD